MLVYNFATFDVLILCWCLHKLPSVVVYAMRILKKVRSVGNVNILCICIYMYIYNICLCNYF